MSEQCVRVLEFYSGIGGMHYALQRAGVNYQVVGAFDINTNANQVYKHNFSDVKIFQWNLVRITSQHLDQLQANCWTMSPPCQPYTRQGKQTGSVDARAQSFLRIMGLLTDMENPPMYILLENVKGFEVSDTHEMFVNVLKGREYNFKEFLLTPTDLGVPNSRTRYYLLARRRNDDSWCGKDSSVMSSPAEYLQLSNQLKDLLSIQPKRIIRDYIDSEDNTDYEVVTLKSDVLKRFYRIMDIVYPDSPGSCCFTKAYTKYIEGTGSVLSQASREETEGVFKRLETVEDEEEKLKLLMGLKLRFFTPREVSRLLMFPDSFEFPASITMKQKYQLLGNSVNVIVIGGLLKHVLFAP